MVSSERDDGSDGAANHQTPLESHARSLLASSTRVLTDTDVDEKSPAHKKLIFPTPCDGIHDNVNDASSLTDIAESTTTLLAARALSKLGRSDISWEFLRTLFAAQGENGFMPRYMYLANEENAAVDWQEHNFIGPYPGPALFHQNQQTHEEEKQWSNIKIGSSETIMAPPHHATTILEIFYLSNQTQTDVDFLGTYFAKLNNWHGFLHNQVILSNCTTNTTSAALDSSAASKKFPCLPIHHPWETEIDLKSPIWGLALGNVSTKMKESGWSPDFEIPQSVKNAFDYPGDDGYKSLLFLAECLDARRNLDLTASHTQLQSCAQFAMLDVGFTAALSKSDQDLMQIGKILIDKNYILRPTWEAMEMLTTRSQRSKKVLRHLWDESRGTFLNRFIIDHDNVSDDPASNGTLSITASVDVPVGYNFEALWDSSPNATMMEHMTAQLLQRSGNFSFGCGDYSLWSIGDCSKSVGDLSSSSMILPLLNYRVSNGLKRNKETGLGSFMQTSTLNLLCGLENNQDSSLENCNESINFVHALNVSSQLPLGIADRCGVSSTLTASIALDMLIPDKVFRYESEPPISNSSVIFLIAVEMVVAFGIGVSCLLLSLNLVRRISRDEEGNDAFIQSVREEESNRVSDLYGEDELLVPLEDNGQASLPFEVSDHDRAQEFEIWRWSLGLASRLNPLHLFGRN